MEDDVQKHLMKMVDIFNENFYVEIQLIDRKHNAVGVFMTNYLREFAQKLAIPTIATPDAHYSNPEDADLQRILLCTSMGNTTWRDIKRKQYKKEQLPLSGFFESGQYYIPSVEEMVEVGHTVDELKNTLKIAEQCEDYELTGKPMLPKYDCPGGITSMDYVRQLCQEGWKDKLPSLQKVIASSSHTLEEYGERYEKEYKVLEEAGLGDYFLIVHDFVMNAKENDILVGSGRGSAAGSLILYLLGVTTVDPIEFDLLFERFYNAGRNTKDRVSLPDIDMDFEKNRRGEVIEYIKKRFGKEHVTQMLTFGTMQGRTALKDVLRVRDACTPAESNRITTHIPGKEEIQDQLQNMKDADKAAGGDGDASIIQWALENHADELSEWAYLDDKGKIQGRMAKYFEQAIALEGTKRSQGKHPAGIVISQLPLVQVCPMVYDSKSGGVIAGMEMNDLEAAGHVKFDILGLSLLDKIHSIANLLENRTL